MKEKKEKKFQNLNLRKEEIMSEEDKNMGIYCPRCRFDNLADTFYCGKCATPLPDSIDHTRIHEVQEEAEKKDPDLKFYSPNDSQTAIIKRLRHFGQFCGDMYSNEERMTLIKMIQEKDYTALFIEYFKAQIEMIFYGERIYWNSWETAHEITHVQAEIMCSIPIELRKELFNRLKEDVDKSIKWWLKGYLKMKDKAKQLKLEKEAEDEDKVPF